MATKRNGNGKRTRARPVGDIVTHKTIATAIAALKRHGIKESVAVLEALKSGPKNASAVYRAYVKTMGKKGAEDEVNWQLDKLRDWYLVQFRDRPGNYILTPKGKAVLAVVKRTLHGWDWRATDPARCGKFVVGFKYPSEPFVVVKCHDLMDNAKTTYKRAAAQTERLFEEKPARYVPRTKVQIRDKRTGQVRHETCIKKPTAAAVARGKGRVKQRNGVRK